MFKVICCCGLAVSFLLNTVNVPAQELDAHEIIQEIRQTGTRKFILKYWSADDYQKSERLVYSISTGTKEWLEVAKLLKSESDAGVTDDLNFAVSKALQKNPVGVLTLLKTKPNDFPVEWICRDPYYEDAVDIATEEKFLKDAENALVQMYDPNQDKELDALRWQCLDGIRRDLRSVEKEKDDPAVRAMPITSPPSGMPRLPDL